MKLPKPESGLADITDWYLPELDNKIQEIIFRPIIEKCKEISELAKGTLNEPADKLGTLVREAVGETLNYATKENAYASLMSHPFPHLEICLLLESDYSGPTWKVDLKEVILDSIDEATPREPELMEAWQKIGAMFKECSDIIDKHLSLQTEGET